jgi:hypothetical protein
MGTCASMYTGIHTSDAHGTVALHVICYFENPAHIALRQINNPRLSRLVHTSVTHALPGLRVHWTWQPTLLHCELHTSQVIQTSK